MIKDNNFSSSSTISSTYETFGSNKRLLLKRLKQNRLYLIMIAITLCIGLGLSYVQPGVGYKVLVNGQHIGFTKNPQDVRNVLASLEDDLKVAKGDNIKFDMDISFVKGKLNGQKLTNADDLKVLVSSMVSIKKPAYILKTDEGVAFAIDSKESMNSILDTIKSKYLNGKQDAKAEIISDVSLLEASSVPVDKIYNYDQAMAYLSSNTTDGIKPKFDVKVTYTATATKTVKRNVVKIQDPSMYEGEMKIKSVGSDGKKTVTSKITEINGTQTGSQVLSEKLISKATDKVILIGTKAKMSSAVQIGYRYLGIPYVWGGTNPSVGLDCSGFTQLVYSQMGIYLPRTSYEQRNVGRRVSRSELRPGDLLHFPGHVAIYIGDGMMIHAPRPGRVVSIDSIDFMPLEFGTRVQ